MEITEKMKVTVFIFLSAMFVFSQEQEGMDSLTLPTEEASSPLVESGKSSSIKSNSSKTSSANNKAKDAKDSVGAILDFEGEVIEGERRRPDLFLQISIDNVKFDSLIYNRDDFNDYLEVDRKSRNKFFKMK